MFEFKLSVKMKPGVIGTWMETFSHSAGYLFTYLITFTTAGKQAVVGVAQQSKAPN